MTVEDVKATAHVRDLVVMKLDEETRQLYRSASVKSWRNAMRNEENHLTAAEEDAVELVESKVLYALRHRRPHQPKIVLSIDLD